MGTRGFTRKIAILEKYDTRLQCGQCHVEYNCNDGYDPRNPDTSKSKVYTSHFAVTPKVQIKETCLTSKCHPKWTEEQANYSIDSVKAHIKGKMRKAEFRMSVLIDRISAAKAAGAPAEAIKKAHDHHLKAHILWEFWTAENSDGFHNPDMAKESLLKSSQEAFNGIKVIDDAMAALKTPSAVPAGK